MSDKYKQLCEKYQHMFEVRNRPGLKEPIQLFGFEVQEGWYFIISMLMGYIDSHLKRNPQLDNFKIIQIKEKFGTLRFYHRGGDEVIHQMVAMVEELSWTTCEFCGSNQNIMRSKPWIKTACKNCVETSDKIYNREGKTWEAFDPYDKSHLNG